jgi:hypothetical protein
MRFILGVIFLLCGAAAISFLVGEHIQQQRDDALSDAQTLACTQRVDEIQAKLDDSREQIQRIRVLLEKDAVDLADDGDKIDRLRALRAILLPYMHSGALIISEGK